MKKLLILFLLLTASASAQFPMVAAWQSGTPSNPALTWDSTLAIYMASSITGKVDGDTLYRWPNSSMVGSASDAFQLTASLKPVYRDTAGTPRVVFDGVDDVMSYNYFTSLPQPGTILAVVKFYSTQVAANKAIFGAGGGAADHVIYIRNITTSDPLAYYAITQVSGNSLSLDSLYAIEAHFSSVGPFLANRGVAQTTTSPGAATASGVAALGGMSGGYYELIYVHRSITPAEREAWLDYVNKKYGVPLP